MTDAKTWRRRERGLFVGVVLWTFVVGAIAAFAPQVLAAWLLETDPLVIIGTMLVTIGALGGASHAAIIAIAGRGSGRGDDLTEWEGT